MNWLIVRLLLDIAFVVSIVYFAYTYGHDRGEADADEWWGKFSGASRDEWNTVVMPTVKSFRESERWDKVE